MKLLVVLLSITLIGQIGYRLFETASIPQELQPSVTTQPRAVEASPQSLGGADLRQLEDFAGRLESGEVSLQPDKQRSSGARPTTSKGSRRTTEGTLAFLRQDKEGAKALWLQARQQIDVKYADFFKMAQLSADEIAKLRDILGDLEMAKTDTLLLTGSKDGKDFQFQNTFESLAKEISSDAEGLLGQERSSLLTEFQRNLPAREDYDNFTQSNFIGNMAVTDTISRQLKSVWLSSYRGPSSTSIAGANFDKDFYDRDALLNQASVFLTSEQLLLLKKHLGR